MTNDEPIVIVSAQRTPIGAFQGCLSTVPAPQLAATAIRSAYSSVDLGSPDIDEVLLGCVLPAGIGQAPARQATLAANLSEAVPAVTINKVCGSGMKSVMLAHDEIVAGSQKIVLAGGMESMSNAPYLLPNARKGYRMGHHEVIDHMFFDGLQNPYDGNMMGHFAEQTAKQYGFTRETQDEFAIESVKRAQAAIASGAFHDEVAAVTVTSRKGETVVTTDEEPGRAKLDRIPHLKPAFSKDGTVTAASSSSISDGAAALVLMRQTDAEKRHLEPLVRIVAHAGAAQAPEWFTTAPVAAIKAVLDKAGWSSDQVDLYEINEAFAVVTLAAEQELALPPERVNVNGGACALGHPIGCSGARILVTLIHALRNRKLKRGIASLCIGGGEATAIAVETL